VFDNELVHDSVDAARVVFDDIPLFDDVPLFDAVATPATCIDVRSTCSMICLHLAVNNNLVYAAKEDAGPRFALYVLFNMDLFYEDLRWLIPAQGYITTPKMGMRSFLSNSVVPDGFEVIQCWDTSLPDGSAFIEIARPCDGFHWDPGTLEGLQFIGLAAFDPAYHYGLHIDEFESKLRDPGLADRSRFIELSGLGSDFHPAQQ
jgi:hypothetical protein